MTANTDYLLRPPTRDDAAAVVELINTCQTALGDEPDMTVEELVADWIGTDLTNEAVLVLTPEGELVGSADLYNRRYVQVNVYADARPGPHQEAVFARLMQWGEAWAASHKHLGEGVAQMEVHHFRRATDEAACRALVQAGYENVRTHYVMLARLTEAPPVPVWPEEIVVGAYRPGEDDARLFEAGEESFQDMWNRPPSTQERWLLGTQAEYFDPALWFLPIHQPSGQAAGVCLCSAIDGKGHVDTLGVRRPWRRQGLGMALLQHAFGEFWRRGIRTVRLSVDASSPTGAPRLYERAGFQVDKQYTRYVKRV